MAILKGKNFLPVIINVSLGYVSRNKKTKKQRQDRKMTILITHPPPRSPL